MTYVTMQRDRLNASMLPAINPGKGKANALGSNLEESDKSASCPLKY